nr:hypothetical protein [candidate division Zixibacteria bacterium]
MTQKTISLFITFIMALISYSMIIMGCSSDSNKGTDTAEIDIIPPGKIFNLTILGPVDSTCLLSWMAPGDDGYSGLATKYDLRFTTDSNILKNWTNAYANPYMPLPITAGNNQQFLVTGLIPDSNYCFAIKTLDNAGNISEISNIVREPISGLPQVAIISPQNGSYISDMIYIQAQAIDDKGIIKVEFFADTLYIGVDIMPPYQIQWDAHECSHESAHIIYAQATDTDNNTVGSGTVICYTDTLLFYPQPIGIIDFSGTNESTCRVIWNRSNELDFAGYMLYYDTAVPITYLTVHHSDTISNIEDTTYYVQNLIDTSKYYFRILSFDIFDHETLGPIDSNFTLNAAPTELIPLIAWYYSDGILLMWDSCLLHDFECYTIFRSYDELITEQDDIVTSIYKKDSLSYSDNSYDTNQTNIYYAIGLYDIGGLYIIGDPRITTLPDFPPPPDN